MLTILFNYPGTGGPPPAPSIVEFAIFTFQPIHATFTFRPKIATVTFSRS